MYTVQKNHSGEDAKESLFVKQIGKVIRLRTVLIIFEDMLFGWGGGLYRPITDRLINSWKNAHIFKTPTQKTHTVHNLITFSIVFLK